MSIKTRIVCTIGPASNSPEMLERMIQAGMNVARLNFSHGDFDSHALAVANIRETAERLGKRVTIMGDLPGPKMRIGALREEPLTLNAGDEFILSSDQFIGDARRVSVSFTTLPEAVEPGDQLFLNDGIINLEVERVVAPDIHCRVRVGGEIRSHKGLNLPGIDLGISAFTDNDRRWLRFASEQRIDALSQSFVANAEDIQAVRQAAQDLDYKAFVIAKIERAQALTNIDAILAATDGIMVARGDLGVEIPIESMAIVQKSLIRKAMHMTRPVITATQMLASMTRVRRPTRAEATDVANAILDGTDCVMLSEESAMGVFPVESVAMLSRIAARTEPHRSQCETATTPRDNPGDTISVVDLIASNVEQTLRRITPAAILVPTLSGATARNIARFRLDVPITAFTTHPATTQALAFSYGVEPVLLDQEAEDWSRFASEWLAANQKRQGLALLVQGPSPSHPDQNHRLEIIEISRNHRNYPRN